MKYLGITRQTAEWFINHKEYLNSLAAQLDYLSKEKALSDGVIAVGPLRITGHTNQLIAIWNNEYITGTDYEDWGFIKLSDGLGLLEAPTILEEVMEGAFFVINQRLNGLYLPEGKNYRPRKNMFTCSAGRGEAWHSSLGCLESQVQTSKGSVHSIICVGPSNLPGFDTIEKVTEESGLILPKLVEISNQLLTKVKVRPIINTTAFKKLKDQLTSEILKKGLSDLPIQSVPELGSEMTEDIRYSTLNFTYEEWILPSSSLSSSQREILESDVLLSQPLRIIGAAGTGKSLLMQLLAMRRVLASQKENKPLRIMYIVHNTEIKSSIKERFKILGAEDFLNEDKEQNIYVTTLFEHSCRELSIDIESIIDKDAQETKLAQRYLVHECIDEIFKKFEEDVEQSDLLKKVILNPELLEAFVDLVMSEIGVAIKGRGLVSDKRQYIESERPLTRFHGVLSTSERNIVFEIFQEYDRWFNKSGFLDSDDVAISFLGHLRTPLWEMKRKKEGFDFVFVDETQLFNQNERLLLKFLAKRALNGHLPIALALDEAQELRGTATAGFGLLGIEDIMNERLPHVYRCTPSILNLAFYIISRTTDLFGTDFPDFTKNTTVISELGSKSNKPMLFVNTETKSLGKSVLKEIRNLRKNNVRQIAIVIHADRYWHETVTLLKQQDLPVVEASKRGELLDPQKPIIYVARPEQIGGQEFDAVICVGLEHGVVPPIINGHPGLTETLEQQSLREMYLAFTRARHNLLVINSKNSSPTPILQQAIKENLIEVSS
jgi:superfamily I DNA/RNA helicase